MTDTPITATEARALFAPWRGAPALVLAVSGGPDSVALLWLMARWRRGLRHGPKLMVVTVDHGLRREGASEARAVKRLAVSLGLDHRTRRWRGPKPSTGLPAAARAARYRLLVAAARASGASHVVTAHTRDDQAETVLMRLLRGSGVSGLAAMAAQSPRDGLVLARPLLGIPKSRLIATLKSAGIGYATDPSNTDPAFTRPRLRALLPALAAEGGDSGTLARLAARMARADAALETMAESAGRSLDQGDGIDAVGFFACTEEIRVRLLLRAIDAAGHEGPADLGKVETLAAALAAAWTARKAGQRALLTRTLAGALIVLTPARLAVTAAPRRRNR